MGENSVVPAACLIALAEDGILSIDGSFLFIFISIFVLIFILNRTLFHPINSVLEDREQLGEGRIAEARRMLRHHDERLRHYEDQVKAARAEANQTLERGRKQALAARQKMIEEARAVAASKIQAARQQIAAEAETAKQGLESDAREMAASISSHILQRPVALPGGPGAPGGLGT
jgi:F-type H+-transporting ATPase subunit b